MQVFFLLTLGSELENCLDLGFSRSRPDTGCELKQLV